MILHDLHQAQASYSLVEAIGGRKQLNKLRAGYMGRYRGLYK